MSDYRPSPEFEKLLRRAVSVPDPDPDFVKELEVRLSKKENQMTPKSYRSSPRLAWGLATLFVLMIIVALANSPTVVEAMKRVFGFVPGVGIVEQNVPLRVLDEPVIVERDSIKLIVSLALLSPDETLIELRFETTSALRRTCDGADSMDRLRLPDGTVLLPMSGGGGGGSVSVHMISHFFAPIPADVHQATLIIPCLPETEEDWEIPLTFVPLPPDLTMEPIIELNPFPPISTETSNAPVLEENKFSPADQESLSTLMPLMIEGAIISDDGYILLCSSHSINSPYGLAVSPHPLDVRFNDANGVEIPFSLVTDADLPVVDRHIFPYVYKLNNKSLEWPLTITVDSVGASLDEVQASFDFDTGPNPQVGQEWDINQDLQIGDYGIQVRSITRIAEGYSVTFQADPEVQSVGVTIQKDVQFQPSGGRVEGDDDGSIKISMFFDDLIPEGKLTVVINSVGVIISGPWSMQWTPDDLPSDGSVTTP